MPCTLIMQLANSKVFWGPIYIISHFAVSSNDCAYAEAESTFDLRETSPIKDITLVKYTGMIVVNTGCGS